MLLVAEIFTSVQGETTFTGRLSSFVRLAGCNLRCRWCDTAYAQAGGEPWDIDRILRHVAAGPRLVTVTGGEPLCQEETPELVRVLLSAGHQVIVETNGSLPIDPLDPGSHRIVDLKPPSSGETQKIHWPNLDRLSWRDEVKIVVADHGDYAWAAGLLAADARLAGVTVNLSPAHGLLQARELASWIVRDGLEVRLNVQLHRILWPEDDAGR